ncbi:MAG: hypothetical protein DCF16_02490 [Alphaproteobacteria bacterium]|nr:MAG: hypothetical protein DCF16_02490 [Alphaproteobacteria bacterium]
MFLFAAPQHERAGHWLEPMQGAVATGSERQIRLEFRIIGYDLGQAAKVGVWGVRSSDGRHGRILFGAAK